MRIRQPLVAVSRRKVGKMTEEYKQIGYVCTEGGPLLIGDYNVLKTWNGIEDGDYEDLIEILEDTDILYPVNGRNVAVWEPEGGATISVHQKEEVIILIKSFEELSENDKYTRYSDNGDTIQHQTKIGEIEILSGLLLILYSTESIAGSTPYENTHKANRLSGDFAFETSTLVIPISNGIYSCCSDYIYDTSGLYSAKRMIITKV